MKQTTAWSHLPNAAHIDRVLADLRERPQAWRAEHAAWNVTWRAEHAAWNDAWGATRDAARDAARNAAWSAARDAVHDAALCAAWDAAGHAISALIAWDHASEYFGFSPKHLHVLANLGDHKAILLLPAVLAMQTEMVDQ